MRRSPLRVADLTARGGARPSILNRQLSGSVRKQLVASTNSSSRIALTTQVDRLPGPPAQQAVSTFLASAPKVPPHVFMGTVRESAEQMGLN